MTPVGNLGELSPHEAEDAASFIQAMQELKERSGLTYRELEQRAARNGDVLARSTLADTLRRTSLPRPDVLAAFVRACGDGRRVAVWLEVRDRLAEGLAASPEPAPQPAPEAEPGQRPAHKNSTPPSAAHWAPSRRVLVLCAVLLAVPLLAAALWTWGPGRSGTAGTPATPSTASATPTDGWVTIRPAGAPELCLTEGRDRAGAYGSAVAVQLPCARADVPRTYLEPIGSGRYRIQWHHPQLGKGCLTVMSAGPVKGMLEPRDDCDQGTLFTAEPAARGAEGFRLRPAHSGDACLGIAGDPAAEGAEAVQERCTGAADQRFLIRPS